MQNDSSSGAWPEDFLLGCLFCAPSLTWEKLARWLGACWSGSPADTLRCDFPESVATSSGQRTVDIRNVEIGTQRYQKRNARE